MVNSFIPASPDVRIAARRRLAAEHDREDIDEIEARHLQEALLLQAAPRGRHDEAWVEEHLAIFLRALGDVRILAIEFDVRIEATHLLQAVAADHEIAAAQHVADDPVERPGGDEPARSDPVPEAAE